MRKPHGLQWAVGRASEVIIHNMRLLLELHYDNVYLANWQAVSDTGRRRAPNRPSHFTTFGQVAGSAIAGLNQRVALPDAMKQILRQPEDESDWD
eukprot:12182315-Karenia_brevis.AAC.1